MSGVDVIVPCYRYGHFLRQCVDSVLSQDGAAVRVLIIDDASPDDTAAVGADLARDPRVTFLRHARNRGHIRTYNEGLDWAQADFLLLLSADDYLLDGALRRSVGLMDTCKDVGFVFGNAMVLHEGDAMSSMHPLKALRHPPHVMTGSQFIHFSGATNIVPTPTAVVRTELQRRVGGYREELPHAGDMEMWLRLAAHASVGFINAYQAVHRRHATNMSIAYARSHLLPDVQQRKAALDCFFQNGGARMADAHSMRRRLLSLLSRETVGFASSAFNEGALPEATQLMAYAESLDPRIRRSWTWQKLALKRRIGLRTWRALEPIVVHCRALGKVAHQR